MMSVWMLVLGCTEVSSSDRALPTFPTITLRANQKDYVVEYACSPHEVALGLRYRKLGLDEGMLLCSEGDTSLSMQKMKSPISAAFLSKEKEILAIRSFSVSALDYPVDRSVRWVWEMPKGWFSQKKIVPGIHVEGIP